MKTYRGCGGPLCEYCGGCIAEGECVCHSTQPNRIVVEIENNKVTAVKAERPDEAVVTFVDFNRAMTDTWEWVTEVYGGPDGLPIEPLPIERTAVGVVGAPVEVRFETWLRQDEERGREWHRPSGLAAEYEVDDD